MEYLEITKKGIPIKVIQSQQIGGLEKLVLGDSERDLVLNTKGNISIQIGNKFINLLKNDGSLEANVNVSNDSILFTNDISKVQSKSGQFVFDTTSKLLYLNVNGTIINIKDSVVTSPVNDTLTNYIVPNLSSIKNDKLIYSIEDKQHYYNDNGIYKPLYLPYSGGILEGNLSFHKLGDDDIYIYGNEITNGIKLENDNGHLNIYNKDLEAIITSDKILNINNTIYLKDGKISIGKSEFNESNTAFGNFVVENLIINDILHSDGFKDIEKYFKENTTGFGFVRRPEGWELQVDTLVVKNPDKIKNISGLNNQKYISKSYYVETIANTIINNEYKNVIELDRTDGINIGDLLLGIEYVNDIVSYRTSIKVQDILTETIDGIEYKTIIVDKIPADWRMHQELINLSNTNVVLNAENSSIVAFDKITDFTEINVLPEQNSDDYIDKTIPVFNNVNVQIGNLNNIIDVDLKLNNTDVIGLYSKKGYYKGNANLEYLKLGDALTYENNVLTINNISEASLNQFKNKKSELIIDSEVLNNIITADYIDDRATVQIKDYDIGSLYDDGIFTYMVIGINKIRRF